MVTRSYGFLIFSLAGVWGASYLFIKVAVEDGIEPAPLMFFRLLLACALLVPFVLAREGAARGLRLLRASWREGLVLGCFNAAVPFTLIAWGEKHIDSGVAAIANASVPIFVTLLAIRLRPSERAAGGRLAGILIGMVGVGVLAGFEPEGGWWGVAGTLAVVVASFSYALAGLYGQGATGLRSGPVLATTAMLCGALILLPFAVLQFPTEAPSAEAVGSLLGLAVGGTAFAQLMLYRTLRLHGAAKLSLVTYLMPPIALFYGALLLDEPLTAGALVGLVLILLGVALGSGAVRLRPRAPVAQMP
jgi:drug/metabolite transporter (DMT)-like permease